MTCRLHSQTRMRYTCIMYLCTRSSSTGQDLELKSLERLVEQSSRYLACRVQWQVHVLTYSIASCLESSPLFDFASRIYCKLIARRRLPGLLRVRANVRYLMPVPLAVEKSCRRILPITSEH